MIRRRRHLAHARFISKKANSRMNDQNIQAPSSKRQRNSKHQASLTSVRERIGAFDLVLLWNLELGVWSLSP
jgi:hypothetical protein